MKFPMLLNEIDSSKANELVASSEWCAQVKHDGRRVMVLRAGNVVHGINRKGLGIQLPVSVIDAAHGIAGNYLIDGELIGDVIYAFDLLELNGKDLSQFTFKARLQMLAVLLSDQSEIILVQAAFSSKDKSALIRSVKSSGGEGVVFKRCNSQYRAGKNHCDQFKLKFWKSVSVVVSAHNEQRSVVIYVKSGTTFASVGNVTIGGNLRVPAVGSVIEVRYLYVTKSRQLYQPIYLGVRDDISKSECKLN